MEAVGERKIIFRRNLYEGAAAGRDQMVAGGTQLPEPKARRISAMRD